MPQYLTNVNKIRNKFNMDKFICEYESLENDLKTLNQNNISKKKYKYGIKNTSEEFDMQLWLEDRISKLKSVIDSMKQTEEKIKKPKKNLKEEINEINNLVFKKSWTRLPIFHKKVKIKEYIEENIKDVDLHKELIDKMYKLIDDNIITKKKYVDYDSKNCKIIKLNFFKYYGDDINDTNESNDDNDSNDTDNSNDNDVKYKINIKTRTRRKKK